MELTAEEKVVIAARVEEFTNALFFDLEDVFEGIDDDNFHRKYRASLEFAAESLTEYSQDY